MRKGGEGGDMKRAIRQGHRHNVSYSSRKEDGGQIGGGGEEGEEREIIAELRKHPATATLGEEC